MWSSGETEAESVDLGVLIRQMAGDATGLDKSPQDKLRASGSLNGYKKEIGRASERDLEGDASERGGDQFTVPTHHNGKVIIER